MNTVVLFEYPLNEKIRTWLRIEFLINQLYEMLPVSTSVSILGMLRVIGDILDIFERNDIRNDLLKELEIQQKKMNNWIHVPGVDKQLVEELSEQLKQQSNKLINAPPRMGQKLREDRLIGLVRQRLNIPGGCCSFDLPALHIWLHQEQSLRNERINHWIESLSPTYDSLNLILKLIRQSGIFRDRSILNGFYQSNTEGTGLLRLRLTLEDELYPQVSGYRNRYVIRFLPLDSYHGKVPERFNFQLACC